MQGNIRKSEKMKEEKARQNLQNHQEAKNNSFGTLYQLIPSIAPAVALWKG